MPARKQWDEEEDDSSTPPSSPPVGAVRRGKFADEEDDDDVLDSWDAADDSEAEREKTKKAEEVKAKVAAEAAAKKKSKASRIAEHQDERRRRAETDDDSDDEDEAARRERLRREEQESDLRHAEDLFAGIGISSNRKATTAGTAVVIDPSDPNKTVNIADLPLFKPTTKTQFENLRTTLAPIVANNNKKAHYALFLQEFSKQLAKDLPSDQIKKIASTLTALGNEKMKEEKAADRGSKKSKAQKTKSSLVTSRANTADVGAYQDDAFGDDDFM